MSLTPKRLSPEYVRSDEARMPNPDIVVSARTDKVLYGPKGDVISRLEDRPLYGFHRQVKS